MDKDLLQKIDDSIYKELIDNRDNVFTDTIFYNIHRHFPKVKKSIFSDMITDENVPWDDSERNDEEASHEVLDDRKMHKAFIDAGYVYRYVGYNSYYFNETSIVMLENVSVTVSSDYEEDIEKIHKMIVTKANESKSSVGMVMRTATGYDTRYLEFDKVDIDVSKNYNDDIPLDRIEKFILKDTTGVALFYGEPGTGKTSFIKYLINKYKTKNFIILDSDLLGEVSSRSLISEFVENTGSIYIIEDAEKLLSSRDHSYNPIISAFLNMSDGITASAINCKFICTFNTALSNIDDAIKRKGRMKVKYEFKKLAADKVNKINSELNKDMSLAELYNYNDENDFSKTQKRKMGF